MADISPSPALVEKLVYANRILYDQGVVDGLGHVSVRHDTAPDVFMLSCNRAPAMVSPRDIVCYDLDGEAVSSGAERPYLERFIHSEIYRARPDVVAVVHSHSPSVIPFGVTGNRLRPIFHMAGFLGSGSSHFEISDVAGDTDMLIRNRELGRALAQSLGDCTCVLMRGHGSTVVGTSIEQVVYRAIYAEVNAKLQMNAQGMGDVRYLTTVEAGLAAATNDSQIGRSWELWRRRIGPIES
ncbi:MAG: aldolase [Ramlibacter sp.]|jgi:ribulose-5-phosphate 4-epimerase/fuculose-1-phosphate aldolase|nr:aldolase [Ramlibacter sp.]